MSLEQETASDPAVEQEGRAPTAAGVVGNFFIIPFATWAYALQLMAQNARDLRAVSAQGVDLMVGGGAPRNAVREPEVVNILSGAGSESGNKPTSKERTITVSTYDTESRTNRDLHDDMLKLVRYKILFVKRGHEVTFGYEQEDLVSDNIDSAAFVAWKIAEFADNMAKHKIDVPIRLKEKKYPSGDYVENGKLTGLPEEDRKYLRVYFEVLERIPRQRLKYEEDQLDVLERINDSIRIGAEGLK